MKRCLLAAMLLLCLCGCGRTDRIVHQTIVTALEITPAEDGWQLAVEYLQQTPPDQPAAYGVLAGEGEELHLALSAIEQQSGRSLYLENCRVLLVCCPPETTVFRQLLEEADKTLKLRPTIPVAVIAKRMLTPEKDPELFVGGEGDRFFSNNRRMDGGRLTLKDHLNTLKDPSRCTASVVLELEEERMVRKGTVLWGSEQAAVLPLQDGLLLPLSTAGRNSRWVMLEESGLEVEIKNLVCQVHWDETGETLGLTITLRCRGELRWAREESAQLALGEGELAGLLEAQGEQLWRQITEEKGIDLFDTGKALSWQKPEIWKILEDTWPDPLRKASCKFVADVVLSDPSGMLEG